MAEMLVVACPAARAGSMAETFFCCEWVTSGAQRRIRDPMAIITEFFISSRHSELNQTDNTLDEAFECRVARLYRR